MKNISIFYCRSVVIGQSRAVESHTHTHTHGKAKFKIFALVLLFIMNSFYSNAQLKCSTHILHIDWGRFFLDGQYMDYDDPVHDDLTHVMEDELFNPSNPQIFYEFPTLNKCDCIHRIFTTCSNNIINADLEVYNSSYVYLYTVEDIIASSYEPGEGCFDFPEDGVFYMKIIEEPGTVNEAAFGWYKITINTHSDIEDILDISVSNNEICRGQQVCVNISNIVFDYMYNIRWNNTLLTSGNIDPPPTAVNYCFTPQTFGTGVITVNSSDLCGDNAVFTQQINVKAFNDFTLPANVCAESSFNVGTITWCNGVVSGASYTWNWGDGTPNSTTQSASHTYANSGTYNVTLTVSSASGTQSMTKQIIVNPLPIEPIVTGKLNTCDLTNLYSISNQQTGTYYTWSIYPQTPVCGTITPPNNGTNVEITWNPDNFPSNYASIIVTSNNGCISRDTTKVWKCCFRSDGSDLLNYTTVTGSLTNISYFINGEVIFEGTNTYSDKSFFLGPEAKIIINNNAQTTFNNCSFDARCGNMWDGITINPGSRLTVNNSRISDAYNAVTSISGARYTLYNTIFNKNLHGINVKSHSGSHTGSVSKCTFKSTTDPFTDVPSFLLPPYDTRRGVAGIVINNVNEITIGNNLSASNLNTFKYLDYGIWINSSNVTVYNNIFGPLPKTSGFIPDNGYGIYLDKESTVANTINVGSMSTNLYYSNTFQNCGVGIRSVHPFNINVLQNTFNNNDFGNILTDNTNRAVVYNTNTFTNNQIGIWCNNFAGTTQNILKNIMTNTTTGVYLSNNVATPIVEVEINENSFSYLNGTTTYNLANGIVLSNVQGYNDFYLGEKKSHIYNNTINFSGVDMTASTTRSGIRIENSPICLIELNTVKYGNNAIPSVTTANKLNGIYVVLSTSTELCSNVLQYLGNGVRIQGYCDNSRFILNDFKRYTSSSLNYSYGFKFESATVGMQGTPTQTWDNKFNYNFLTGTPNRGTGTIALQQQWNYKNNNNLYLFRLNNEQQSNTLHSGWNISSTITCGQQGNFLMNGFNDNNEMSLDSESEFLENDAENKYFKAYTILNSESSFNESETILPSYINSSIDVENISKFSEVNRLVKDRLFERADSLNQLIEPANLIEKNMKTVNEIYLRTWAKGIYDFSIEDYTTLVDIAMQTPKTSGYGVIGAWVMVGRFDNTQETEKFSNSKINIISNSILMYPNPAKSQLTFEGTELVVQIFIHDVMGRLVRVIDNQQLDNAISISINDLKKGIYIVTYTNELGEKIGFEKLTIN